MGSDSHIEATQDQAPHTADPIDLISSVDIDAMTLPRATSPPMIMPRAGEIIAQRYTLEETLGMGTYGQVFSAWDNVRSHRVALKILRDVSPAALLRFKHEFRALNDLRHPNLVRVFKLGRDRHIWFIAMELVRGVPFTQPTTNVRTLNDPQVHSEETAWLEPRTRPKHLPSHTANTLTIDDSITPIFDLYTVRDRMLQLSQGISALHRMHIIHCDLKPSNILVTQQGRVVILDFGVSQNVSPLGAHQHHDGLYAGTRAYMAPEVLHTAQTTPAFDWYAVGMMLAELLTGHHASILSSTPYPTLCDCFIQAKQSHPSYQELLDLALALLHPDPERRASYKEVLAACKASAIEDQPAHYHAQTAFVGREHELARLHQSYQNFLEGTPETIIIEGPHGSGKSALCRQFLQEIILSKSPAYVLFARCKSDELLGYRAFDEVVDGLAAVLRALPKEEREHLQPLCTPALTSLFPALRSIHPSGQLTAAPTPTSEFKEDALYALHELLAEVAHRRRLIIWVDDIHNADRDSLRWIARIFGPGVRPHALLLLTQQPRATLAHDPVDIRTLGYAVPRISLQTFNESTARAAVKLWLSPAMAKRPALIDEIVTLGQGRPDALRSLCRYADYVQHFPRDITLAQLIENRIRQLSQLERELLSIIALALGPVDIRMIMRLCDARPVDIDQALYWLSRKMLIRSATTIDDEHYEVWDQSVYHAVRQLLDAETQQDLHRRFAEMGEQLEDMRPATLLTHLTRARDFARAESYALQRAAASERAGAWESAAELYNLLLQLHQTQDKQTPTALTLRAIDCQLRTGRLPAAAALMAALAERLPRDEAYALHLRAAETYTLCGMPAEGNAQTRRAQRLTGRDYFIRPIAPQLVRVAALRAKIEMRIRMLDISKLTDAPLEPTHETLLGTLRVSGIELGLTDATRAFEFSLRELDLALDLNRKLPIARALASFCSLNAGGGLPQQQRAYRWLDLAQRLTGTSKDQLTEEWIKICRYTVDYQMGHYKHMWERLDQSHQWLTKNASHQSLMVTHVDVYRLLTATLQGDLPRLRKIYYNQIADARVRNNRNAEITMTLIGFLTWFLDDAPAAARSVIHRIDTIRPATADDQQLYHFFIARSKADIALYEQNTRAISTNLKTFQGFESTMLCQNVESVRQDTQFTLGRLALAQAKQRRSISRKEKQNLMRWGQELAQSHVPLAQGWGNHLLAGLAMLENNPRRAQRLLERAIAAHQEHELHLFGEISRAAARCAGFDAHTEDPYQTLRSMGIVRPERLVQSYHPYL